MGEVSEMMLDGTLCQKCGVFIGEPTGSPKTCKACKQIDKPKRNKPKVKK